MASKVTAKRVDLAKRQIAVDVQDDFGNVTTHAIPLTSDSCPHCGFVLPGSTNGSPDVNASIAAVAAVVDQATVDLATKLMTLPDYESMLDPATLAVMMQIAKANPAPVPSPSTPPAPSVASAK